MGWFGKQRNPAWHNALEDIVSLDPRLKGHHDNSSLPGVFTYFVEHFLETFTDTEKRSEKADLLEEKTRSFAETYGLVEGISDITYQKVNDLYVKCSLPSDTVAGDIFKRMQAVVERNEGTTSKYYLAYMKKKGKSGEEVADVVGAEDVKAIREEIRSVKLKSKPDNIYVIQQDGEKTNYEFTTLRRVCGYTQRQLLK